MQAKAMDEKNVIIARTQMGENAQIREFLNTRAVLPHEVYDYAFRKKSANELSWSMTRFCRVLDRVIALAKIREAEKRLRSARNKQLTNKYQSV